MTQQVHDREATALYTDGGLIGRNPSPIGGTWAWCTTSRQDGRIDHASGVILPADLGLACVTNNNAELWAMICGLEALPAGWTGTVFCDSMVTIGRMFYGWRMVNVPVSLQKRADVVLTRLGRVKPVLLDGHPTQQHLQQARGKNGHPVSIHNVFCDRACTEQAVRYRERMGQ
jgi:ribonuclease HI